MSNMQLSPTPQESSPTKGVSSLPTAIPALLTYLRERQVRLWVDDGRLRFRAPEGTMSPELLRHLRLHKAALTQALAAVAALHSEMQRPIPPISRKGPLPLSFAQERLWFLAQIHGSAEDAYHMATTLRLCGRLHVEALTLAFDQLIARHEILRTTFYFDGEQPRQQIAATAPIAIQQEHAHERAWQPIVEVATKMPFDLATGPLMHLHLLKVNEHEHLLTIAMHHLIADGWSIQLLVSEVATLYGAIVAGKLAGEQGQTIGDPLPSLPIQYADYAQWQRTWLQGEWLAQELAHWQQVLQDAPPLLELPTDHPRLEMVAPRAGHLRQALSHEVVDQVRALAQEEGATLFMALFAAFTVLLTRYSGQHDIVVGTPVAARNHPDLEALVGFFVNTILLRIDLSQDPSFRTLLGRVRTFALDAFAHQDLPFIKLVEHLRP
ncbi:MAG: hypothetical protein KDE47_33110, partial [Caldilineaceae bacterium]|nr:hypothetical protein [Caldilineaceae bacterium]